MKNIAVLGSGVVGEVLANGFLKHGYSVMRGSREPAKLADWKAKAGGNASTGTLADAAKWADTVVLAVKGSAAESALDQAGIANLAGKVVIDATNPITEGKPPANGGVLEYFTSMNESLIERLQHKAPQAKFVKAFNSVANAFMVNPSFASKPTMFICGNDAGAKAAVGEVLGKFGWETADMGPVEAGRAIEPLCMLYCIRGIGQGKWNHAFKMLTLS